MSLCLMESYKATVTIYITGRLSNPLGCDICKQTLFLNIKKKNKRTRNIDYYLSLLGLNSSRNKQCSFRDHKWFLTDMSLSRDLIFYYDLFTTHPKQTCIFVHDIENNEISARQLSVNLMNNTKQY